MKIDKEKFVCIGNKELPDTIRYKRGKLFLIILGYIFAVIAGVNGVEGVHDILYSLMGYLGMGLINRIVAAVQILLTYIRQLIITTFQLRQFFIFLNIYRD